MYGEDEENILGMKLPKPSLKAMGGAIAQKGKAVLDPASMYLDPSVTGAKASPGFSLPKMGDPTQMAMKGVSAGFGMIRSKVGGAAGAVMDVGSIAAGLA